MDKTLSRSILELELSLLKSEVRQSAQCVEELLSADFMEFTSSGKIYRYQRGDIFNSPANGEIKDFAIQSLCEDCVLATYRFVREDGTATMRSSVWQRFDHRWKIIFHQGTPEAQPPTQP